MPQYDSYDQFSFTRDVVWNNVVLFVTCVDIHACHPLEFTLVTHLFSIIFFSVLVLGISSEIANLLCFHSLCNIINMSQIATYDWQILLCQRSTHWKVYGQSLEISIMLNFALAKTLQKKPCWDNVYTFSPSKKYCAWKKFMISENSNFLRNVVFEQILRKPS